MPRINRHGSGPHEYCVTNLDKDVRNQQSCNHAFPAVMGISRPRLALLHRFQKKANRETFTSADTAFSFEHTQL